MLLFVVVWGCGSESSTSPDTGVDLVADLGGDQSSQDVASDSKIPDATDLDQTESLDILDVEDVPLDLEVVDLVEDLDLFEVTDLPPEVADIEDVAPDETMAVLEEVADLAIIEDIEEDDWVPPPCEPGDDCTDGDPCTNDDTCVDGECVGTPYTCNDGRPCTLDVCDGMGNCSFTLLLGKCLINGQCYKSGDRKEGNQCVTCNPLQDSFSWTVNAQGDCDDDDACTTGDHCVAGECVGDILSCNDNNPCTLNLCDSDYGCSFPPANIPCDDGNLCTALDFCEDGVCIPGPAPACDDLNPCTKDTCIAAVGCYHEPLNGIECDDGDACTLGDVCHNNVCQSGSGTMECDDWNDCTEDVCDPLHGCVYPLNDNPCCVLNQNICDDHDPCTIDTCNPNTGQCIYLNNDGPCSDGNACTVDDICVGGVCLGEDAGCDDGSPCTSDFCHSALGCVHDPINSECDDDSVCTLNDWCQAGECVGTPVNCNDYNLCTDDFCDPDSGCINEFNSAACNDYDLCTSNDHCDMGECVGDEKTCNDGNQCTNDFCDPAVGCQNVFNEAACDDGNECTEGDHCDGGECVSGTLVCLSCNYAFDDAVNRVHVMQISTTATAGTALDLDNNGVYDNSMAGIGGLANGPLQDALNEGTIHLMLEHHGLQTNGSIYTVAGFLGDPAPGFESCNFAADYCGYTVTPSAMDLEACSSLITFDNASIYNGVLVAGGMNYLFPFAIPLSETTMLNITLYAAAIRANVTIQGGVVTHMEGIIGGAVPKSSFVAALDAVPDEDLPLPKSMILQMIDGLISNDIDTDGNGIADAASIAIKFEAIPCGILGIQ